MVKQLVDTISSLPARRRQLVRLDHIAITFSNCIITLSELESLVCFEDGIIHRLKWAWTEKKVVALLPRLESQKSSLSLMVTVLHWYDWLRNPIRLPAAAHRCTRSQTEMEALQGRDRLNAAVDLILQRDQDFAARLQRLEDPFEGQPRSIRFFDNESRATAFPPNSSSSEPGSLVRREFEEILENSRVYSRSESNESDKSFTSSAVLSHAWSMLSLNDISIVAVFRLPITLDDIESFGPGLTFGMLLRNPIVTAIPAQTTSATSLAGPSTQQQITAPGTLHSDDAKARKIPASKKPKLLKQADIAKEPKYVDGKRVVAEIKLVIVGDGNTEKTRTLITYTKNKFPDVYVPTVFENYAVTVMIGEDPYILGLWDTAGQEDYDRLRPLSYPQTDVFLVFARVGSVASYQNIEKKWVPEISHFAPRVPFILVGIDCDDRDAINHDPSIGHDLVDKVGAVKYMECNIVTQKGLKDVFDAAIIAALSPPRRERKSSRRSWRPGFLRTVTENKDDDQKK
ncbi:hypothetical protein NM208_g989 [Fusarium decemcellulare]|uniref:Uncharacterized protein n=1 Tax=Fusarium decemcellulare TaxID=57161 RepID=A0ACC1SYA2_9HYPO|nr:hypothetical protein NM208_g989 [Fusarium decemcellulare]